MILRQDKGTPLTHAELDANLTEIVGDVTTLNTNVATINTNVATINTDVATLLTDVSNLNTISDAAEIRITTLEDAPAGGGASPFAVQATEDGTYQDAATIIEVPYTGNSITISYNLMVSFYENASFTDAGQFQESVIVPAGMSLVGVQELGGYRNDIKNGIALNGGAIDFGHQLLTTRKIIVDNGVAKIILIPNNQLQGTNVFFMTGTYEANENILAISSTGFPFSLPG